MKTFRSDLEEIDMEKTYLGDGVYIDFDGYHLILTTNNGIRDTSTIYLDPGVQVALVKFIERMVELGPKRASERSPAVDKDAPADPDDDPNDDPDDDPKEKEATVA
jgi:hypothetical protein